MPRYIEKIEKLTLPVVPLRGLVAFPSLPLNFELVRDISISACNAAVAADMYIFLVAQKDMAVEVPEAKDLYTVGTVAKIRQTLKTADGHVRVIAEGMSRASVSSYMLTDGYMRAEVLAKTVSLDKTMGGDVRTEATMAEALDALEPYGAGNGRPVFCLRGATLERAQNVGQNRHLKLRLSKGNARFDGIFFSAVSQTCGVEAGGRVDAAFYLQVNEFRGNRSVQLQMVDIRPSLSCSTKEEEALQMVQRCLDHEGIHAKEAMRLLPSREHCVRAWRALQRAVPAEGLQTYYLPFLRQLAADTGGAEAFARAALCLEIFRERGLVSLRRTDDEIRLMLTDQGKKVNLDESEYLQKLKDILEMPKRGDAL